MADEAGRTGVKMCEGLVLIRMRESACAEAGAAVGGYGVVPVVDDAVVEETCVYICMRSFTAPCWAIAPRDFGSLDRLRRI